jgi:hypothetical protein
MIEIDAEDDFKPIKGYTGIVRSSAVTVIYVNGKHIGRDPEHSELCYWWYTVIPNGRFDSIFSAQRVVPAAYAALKDHPVLGKELMNYMLSADFR